MQSDLLMELMANKNPDAMRKEMKKIELFPDTGVMITPNALNMAKSDSNGSKRGLIRNLFAAVVSEEEMIFYNTENNLNTLKPEIRTAIIGYITQRYDTEITSHLYNDVVNRRILQAKNASKKKQQLTEESDCEGIPKSEEKKCISSPSPLPSFEASSPLSLTLSESLAEPELPSSSSGKQKTKTTSKTTKKRTHSSKKASNSRNIATLQKKNVYHHDHHHHYHCHHHHQQNLQQQ